ncbi:hypothetical protein KZ849_34045 [Pseudomonas aeruginosa]|nr:hypothetical protein [Pseudomonas aeruginosa]MBW6097547.1 hypothetical protein [Pseudomonas aeruginosa]
MSVLFAYPGQGAQRPGMLAALPDEPPVRACLEQAADCLGQAPAELESAEAVSYTHLRAHETLMNLVCRRLLEKKKKEKISSSFCRLFSMKCRNVKYIQGALGRELG